MPQYVVLFKVGKSMAVEGERLQFDVRQGSDAALIFVTAAGNESVAVFPADAVAAVYKKDAWRNPRGALSMEKTPQEEPPRPAGARPRRAEFS
jgi:hypothetical protein